MTFLRFLLLLLVAGCSAEAPPKPAASQAKASPVADTNVLPVYGVAVDRGGLLLTDPKSKEAKPAPFGLRQSLMLGILARTQGAAEEGHDAKCNRDFAQWENGLTLWFESGTFVGWTLKEGGAVGVAPGVVRAPVMTGGAVCG